MEEVGKRFNSRYVKQSEEDTTPTRFLSSYLNPNEVYIRSTDTKRTCKYILKLESYDIKS